MYKKKIFHFNFFLQKKCHKNVIKLMLFIMSFASYSIKKELRDQRRPATTPTWSKKNTGPLGESNPRPPPPEGGIIPLDQAAYFQVSKPQNSAYLRVLKTFPVELSSRQQKKYSALDF